MEERREPLGQKSHYEEQKPVGGPPPGEHQGVAKGKVSLLRHKLSEKAKRSRSFGFTHCMTGLSARCVVGRVAKGQSEWRRTRSGWGEYRSNRENRRREEALIEGLHQELKTKSYRPRAVKRVSIEKPDGRKRPLGIPVVRDRVVQAHVC